MADQHMLTTIDNPFDPFDNFNAWYAWDIASGYHTLGYLARIAVSSNDLSEADQSLALFDAMKEIVQEDLYGVHRILTREKVDKISE